MSRLNDLIVKVYKKIKYIHNYFVYETIKNI